jgi:uncharacterized membrane protein YedE/YeeE
MTLFSSYLPPLLGGAMIGLAAGGLRFFANEIAGISGIARAAVTGPRRGWCLAFVAGLLGAGLVAGRAGGAQAIAGLEHVSLGLLLIAGLCVGLGTGLGNGCTSGHGICGLARFSPRSLVAVLTFMATAALTVFLMRHVVQS